MTIKDIDEDVQPAGPQPIGTVNNELEKMAELGAAPIHKEIGLLNDEMPGAVQPIDLLVGRLNNERSDTQKSPDDEIGLVNNEKPATDKPTEPVIIPQDYDDPN